MNKTPVISVIIPTYHDWNRLKLCLSALEMQSFNKNDFEIIVVNNDPSDKFFKQYTKINLTIINESKKGSYAARNAGIGIAKGRLLAFTDSDCIPSPDWLSEAYSFFLSGKKRFAGPINLFSENEYKICSLFENMFSFNQSTQVNKGRAMTANMFVCKSLFETVGLFNDKYVSGGDIEWGDRASLMGYEISYYEKIYVMHPTRSNIRELLVKRKRVAIGDIGHKGNQRVNKTPSLLINIFIPPVGRIKYIFSVEKLSIKCKIQLSFLACFLKVYSIYVKLLINFGIKLSAR